jgi:hypothetical protein
MTFRKLALLPSYNLVNCKELISIRGLDGPNWLGCKVSLDDGTRASFQKILSFYNSYDLN